MSSLAELLAGFEDVPRSLPGLLERVRRKIPVQTCVVVEHGAQRARATAWLRRGAAPMDLLPLTERARSVHAYLVGDAAVLEVPAPGEATAAAARTRRGKGTAFVTLPLVRPGLQILGLLQVGSTSRLREADVEFLGTFARQLSLALARSHAKLRAQVREGVQRPEAEDDSLVVPNVAIAAEHARAGAGSAPNRRQLSFLASASALLGATLDEACALRVVAQLAASSIADACVIDLLDGASETSCGPAPNFADPDVREEISALTRAVAEEGTVEASRRARRAREPHAPPRAGTAERLALALRGRLDAVRVVSVPVHGRTRCLGAITLIAWARYRDCDVETAKDLAGRVGSAVENARAHRAAVEALERHDQALAIVSHDLRSPLGAILLNAQTLLANLPASEVQQPRTRQARSIERSVRRATRLVEDLVDTAGHGDAGLGLRPARCDLSVLIGDVFELNEPAAAAASVELRRRIDPELPIVVVDGERVIQVLSNLIGNALRFTPAGGHVTIGAHRFGTGVRLTVADTGAGIAAADLPRVFGRFWRSEASSSSRGLGLGLDIARRIVEGHGGTISIESTIGIGTEVAFTLPQPAHRATAADHVASS